METFAAVGSPTPTVPCFFTYIDPFAFHPDGELLFIRGIGGIQKFNLHTMREEQFIVAPTNLNSPALALSPDGKVLAWALEGGTVQRVRLSDLRILTTIRTRQPGSLKLEFSPSGDELYSASHDDGIIVWDDNGDQLRVFRPGGELMNFGISPDGQILATVSADGPLSIWSSDTFTLFKELGAGGGYDTSDVAFSSDGKYIAADLANGLFLWEIATGIELLGAQDGINSMAVDFSQDGEYLAYANLDGVILSTPDGLRVIRTLKGHQSPVFRLLFSPDSSIIVSADDREIRVWRVNDGQLLSIGKRGCP